VVVNNIKMDLTEVDWTVVDWIYLVDDRKKWRAVVSMVMNIRVTQSAGSFFTS
jgi:hypothetical protein